MTYPTALTPSAASPSASVSSQPALAGAGPSAVETAGDVAAPGRRVPGWVTRSLSSVQGGVTSLADLDWLLRVLSRYPRPADPLDSEWEISLTGLAAQLPLVPAFATKPLGFFDGLGAVLVGPDRVGFDGDEVDWDRVLEIHTQPSWATLPVGDMGGAVVRRSLHIPDFVPGARWASRAVANLTCTLFLAAFPLRALTRGSEVEGAEAAEVPVQGPADELSDEAAERMQQPVVSRLVYRGRFGKTKEIEVGPAAVFFQVLIPSAVDAISAAAVTRGIPVTHVPGIPGDLGTAHGRGAAWRSRFTSLTESLGRAAEATAPGLVEGTLENRVPEG